MTNTPTWIRRPSGLLHRFSRLYFSRKALRNELSRVPILESGLDGQDRIPYAVLNDGTTLFGRPSTVEHHQIYRQWERYIASVVLPETTGLAVDIITRYLYPHALPNLTMPYPRRLRRAFHLQHVQTIEDLPGLSSTEIAALKKLFTPRPGETFLDLGAYLGYGTVRMATLVGTDSTLVAVEADPDNFSLLKRNVEVNRLSNTTVVPKAVWSGQKQVTLFRTDRQANSLINDIVGSGRGITVESATVDQIVRESGIREVNIVSVTLNGAEVEAIDGMQETLADNKDIRISAAGWYMREQGRISEIIAPTLAKSGLNVRRGDQGGILAWKRTGAGTATEPGSRKS